VGLVACGGEQKQAEQAPAAPAGAPAVTVDPATAATITGSVKVEGTPAKGRPYNMAAEPACAKKHGGPVPNEEVVTGDAGALANVIVYVKEGLKEGTWPISKESVVLDQSGCLYTPRVLAVMATQNIEIKNSDPTTHNIHPTPANNREWNESQPQGAAPLIKAFAREENAPPIPVKCNVHPWMKAYIAVFKHPYFSVTGKPGSFSIKNLPPGEYTLEAWHEKLGTTSQKVTVGAKESKSVEFVFKAAAGD
jgi:hypothetical protein